MLRLLIYTGALWLAGSGSAMGKQLTPAQVYHRLTPAQRENRARHEYQRIWHQDRPFFGAKGQPAPQMIFGRAPNGSSNSTSIGPYGERTIYLGGGVPRNLRSSRPKKYANARLTVEHELARIFQPDHVLQTGGLAGAGVANAVSNRLAHFRNTGQGNPLRYNRRHLPYFGQNPQTIPFPVGP